MPFLVVVGHYPRAEAVSSREPDRSWRQGMCWYMAHVVDINTRRLLPMAHFGGNRWLCLAVSGWRKREKLPFAISLHSQ
jgi:hypothetical protein